MHDLKNKIVEPIGLLDIALHDIQSPLRFMSTIVHDLLVNYQSMEGDAIKEHLNMLYSSINSLQLYCDNIKNWENQKEQQNLSIHSFSVAEIFADVKKMYAPLAAFKKIELKIVETAIVCKTNKEMLLVILLNIVDNAYKNTNSGFICLSAAIEHEKLYIKISDTGKGMEQKEINSIIGNKRQLKKSGLGLVIIKNLLKKLNGFFSIESEIGKGTTVTINLPCL